jgi:hypothetical protein
MRRGGAMQGTTRQQQQQEEEEREVKSRSRLPLPRKTATAAGGLALIGFVFLMVGMGVWLDDNAARWETVPFFVLAAIGLIPGVYHSVILIRAYLGHEGYDYSMVPSFDQD